MVTQLVVILTKKKQLNIYMLATFKPTSKPTQANIYELNNNNNKYFPNKNKSSKVK